MSLGQTTYLTQCSTESEYYNDASKDGNASDHKSPKMEVP